MGDWLYLFLLQYVFLLFGFGTETAHRTTLALFYVTRLAISRRIRSKARGWERNPPLHISPEKIGTEHDQATYNFNLISCYHIADFTPGDLVWRWQRF